MAETPCQERASVAWASLLPFCLATEATLPCMQGVLGIAAQMHVKHSTAPNCKNAWEIQDNPLPTHSLGAPVTATPESKKHGF